MEGDENQQKSELKKFSFNLNPEEDDKLLESLESADAKGTLNQHIMNLLRLGHIVQLTGSFQTSKDSLDSLMGDMLGPLDSRIGGLEHLVQNLQGSFIGSSAKGGIGEQIVIGHLSTAFTGTKGDQFISKGHEGHSGDIEAQMAIETSPGVIEAVPVMIEAKLYESTVKSKEVDKFWDDLAENKYRFGLFVSLNQRVEKQNQCISIEMREGNYGIIVYNENHEQLRHLVAYAMMRELIKLVLSGKVIRAANTEVLSQLISNLASDLSMFKDSLSTLGEIERAALDILTSTAKHISVINKASGRMRIQIEEGINRMEFDIQRASSDMNQKMQQQLGWNRDVWTPAVNHFSDKQIHLLTALRPWVLQISNAADISFETSNNPIIEFRNKSDNQLFMELESQSSKIQIRLHGENLDVSDNISARIKNGQVIIDLQQSEKTIGDVNWPILGELILSAANESNIS